MTIYRARTVYPITGNPIHNGAVLVDGPLIRAVGHWKEVSRESGEATIDLGEQILLPGLINAHCHLDYSMMRRAILAQPNFTEWIKRINALKRSFGEQDYLQAISEGFQELIQWGTTTVLNIESFPELLPKLPPPPIRTWWFYELIDIRHRVDSDDLLMGALSFFDRPSSWLGGFGLSPHAPFTATPDLFRVAEACATQYKMPLTTHLAESVEEWHTFVDGSGPLYEFLKSLGRDMSDCGGTTPMRWFLQAGLDPRKWLLAHVNEFSDGDLQALGNHLRGIQIVHCPLSHAYFRHRPFRASELATRGATLCLGTDSLASTQSLNLFQEMRQFARQNPEFSPAAILRMTTINPAHAIGAEKNLGQIRPGAFADLIALPDHGTTDPAETVLTHRDPITWMLVNGKSVAA